MKSMHDFALGWPLGDRRAAGMRADAVRAGVALTVGTRELPARAHPKAT
jgi:hypothetical protein